MTSLARRRIVALCLHRCALRPARHISTSITKDEQTNDPNADLTNSHGMNIHNWYNEEDKQQNLRILTTLNPQRLRHTDFVDFSAVPYPHVSFYPGTPAIPIHFYKKNGVHQPFPAATRGFLYFHRPSDAPALAAGIRLRLTSNGRPSSFRDGTDLQGPEGLPWQISLFKIAHAVGRVEELRTQLLEEGLIHETDLTEARDATPTRKRLDPRLTLYSLSQPFPVAFERTLRLWVAGVHATRLWTYDFMFADNRMQFRPLVRPYAGAALAQFELSQLPEHAGTQTLVVRIARMLVQPSCVVPGYDGYVPPPVDGALVRRPMGRGRGVRVVPWHCDLAGPGPAAAVLRMLVENTPGSSSPPDPTRTAFHPS